MAYLPSSKFGSCVLCGATNVNCVKVKKELHCISCHRGNKTTVQIQRANDRDRQRQASVKEMKPKAKRELKRSVASSVRGLINTPQNKETLSKSKLLKMADAVFSRYIINRDTTNGQILCPCCRKTFDVLQVDKDGKKVVQNLHFVSRSVYSLRFDTENAHAGDNYCNLQMHLHPTGHEYQNYRLYLVNKLGEEEVARMEQEHRKINRIEEQMLKTVIEHYQA